MEPQLVSSDSITPNTPPNRNKSHLIMFLVIFLLIIIAIPLLLLHLHHKTTPTKTSQATPLAKQTVSIKNVLIPYVPNFTHLTLADLPSISSYSTVTQVFPYKGTLLVVGQNKIIQLDAKSQKILRMSNTEEFDCAFRGTLIGDNLYIFCQDSDENNPTKIKRGIYILNLKKNEITDKYVDQDPIKAGVNYVFSVPSSELSLVNAEFATQGNILWIGTWNRVIQLDTTNGKIQIYTPSQLGFTGQCNSFSVGANIKYVYTTAAENSTCTHGGISLYKTTTNSWKRYIENSFPTDGRQDMSFVAIGYSKNSLFAAYDSGGSLDDKPIFTMTAYDPKSDLWKKVFDYYDNANGYTAYATTSLENVYFPYYQITNSNTSHPFEYFNQETGIVTTSQFNIPSYLAISNQINNSYYLFATDGIYKLTANSFPTLLLPETNFEDSIETKAFVNADQTYALLLGQNAGAGYTADIPEVKLINLSSGEIKDLSSITKGHIFNALITNLTFTEIPDGVIVKNSSGKVIVRINFASQQISFQ